MDAVDAHLIRDGSFVTGRGDWAKDLEVNSPYGYGYM